MPARLLQLAWPMVGLNVLQVLALAVDTAMCGRLPDADGALTALGFATQVAFILLVAMIGLSASSVALVSRAYGGGDPERVNYLMSQSTQLTLMLSVGVALVGNLGAPALLSLLGASEGTVPLALDYLRPLMTFSLFSYLAILYGATLRGVGNTRIAFEAALLQNLLNVLFNYGLILGNFGLPSLGVGGAAIGTVLSQFVGVGFLLFRLHRGVLPGIRAPLGFCRIDRKVTGDLWRIGWPAALDMVILNAGFVAVVGMVGHYDEVAVAAHSIGLRIQGLAFVPGLAIARAAGAMIGNALGAENRSEARSLVFLSLKVCGGVMSSLGALMIVLSAPIVSVFGLEQGTAIAEYTLQWVWILGAGMPIVGVWIAFAGMLQGSGHTMESLRINGVSTLLIQIPLCWLLGYPLGLGPLGVWLGFPGGFLIKALLGVRAYRSGEWARTGMHVGSQDPSPATAQRGKEGVPEHRVQVGQSSEDAPAARS